MSSKKQVQRQGLILSTQHISVSTFNTYAGKQVHKAMNSYVLALYILVTTQDFQKKHSHVYTSSIGFLTSLKVAVLTFGCVLHTHTQRTE